ncbi:MAG: hypothetical protein QXZ13_01305 [Candidatus Diapherotrites archaeon]
MVKKSNTLNRKIRKIKIVLAWKLRGKQHELERSARELERLANQLNENNFKEKIRLLGLKLDSNGNIIPQRPSRELTPRQKRRLEILGQIASSLIRKAQRRRRLALKLREWKNKLRKK